MENSVSARTSGGEGCPFCSSHRVSITNSLQSKNPELSKLWHPTKNGELLPKDITEKSGQKVWWKCPKGPDHEWKSSPSTIYSNSIRSKSGHGCPCCSNHKLSVTNCLQNVNPELSTEWNTQKNKKRPDEVIAGGHTKYWWKCAHGHEWLASISKRMPRKEIRKGIKRTRGRGCPYCKSYGSARKPSREYNLNFLEPELVKRLWDFEKNEGVTPDEVLPGSNLEYWWKCPEGPDHIWKQSSRKVVTANKGTRSNGCPFAQVKEFL